MEDGSILYIEFYHRDAFLSDERAPCLVGALDPVGTWMILPFFQDCSLGGFLSRSFRLRFRVVGIIGICLCIGCRSVSGTWWRRVCRVRGKKWELRGKRDDIASC